MRNRPVINTIKWSFDCYVPVNLRTREGGIMNRLILRSLVAALLLLVLLSVPSIASADSILWTLTNVAFTPIAGTSGVAGTATGSFDFDATMGPMGTFSNIDIK